MDKRKKILVSPLDWGLGHATRCIPIIRYLVANNYEVIVAASGNSKKIIQEIFPKLHFVHLEGYRVKYSKKNHKINFISQLPKIFFAIKKEHQWLKEAIKKYQLDMVISDNRYGLYSSKIPCVLITHQLNIQVPKTARKITRELVDQFIEKFTECWVPDYEGENSLAGKLSHQNTPSSKIKYLGLLSRFDSKSKTPLQPKNKYLVLVSGPETQRTIFEKEAFDFLSKTREESLVICGLPQEDFHEKNENITRVSHLPTAAFIEAVVNSKIIICRSGYSTIMDLIALGRNAILVPTPGQTEQEYLAKYLNGQFGFRSVQQKNMSTKLQEISNLPTTSVDLPINNMAVVQAFLETYLIQK